MIKSHLGDELKKSLMSEAKLHCKINKFFCIKQEIQLVPLQFSQDPKVENLVSIGKFHHRTNISQTAIKPALGDISISDIFIKSKEYAANAFASNQSYCRETNEREITACANMVGVIGQAGSGKTTLAESLLRRIVDEGLFESNYVFYLKFCEVDYFTKTNLLSFLAKSLSLSWIDNASRRNAVLKKLSSRNDVVLIMDGFDESAVDASSPKCSLVTERDIAKPEIFIKNILKGTILKNVKKILTSRPRQLLDIATELRPKYLLNILGISLEAQYQICKNICNDNADKIFNYIQQHPSIASYCSVPSNCILVIHALNTTSSLQLNTKTNFFMPKTISGIITIVVCLFFKSPHVRNHRSEFSVQKLAQLAWHGLVNRKDCFTEADLIKCKLTIDEIGLILTTRLSRNALSLIGGDPSKISSFSHHIIQEFFAALYLICFISLKTFKKLVIGKNIGPLMLTVPQYDVTEGSWEMVTKFMFGICNINTQNMLKNSFSFFATSVSEKADLLCSVALRNVPNAIFSPNNTYFQSIISVCSWIHEMNDIKLAATTAKRLKKIIVIEGKILPSDIAPFTYILLQRKTALMLNCTPYETWFVGNSLHLFLEEMMKLSTAIPFITVI